MFTKANGMNRRQPRSINWSYRNRGSIQRTQMKTTIRTTIFAMNTPMWKRPPNNPSAGVPRNGNVHPPKNKVTIIAALAIMFAYSPRKKSANFIELYSV